MGKIELINVDDLFEGMVLGEDIFGKFDLLVLSRGKVLNQQNISVLKNQGLDYVYIELNPSAEAEFEALYEELVNELNEVFLGSGKMSQSALETIQCTLTDLMGTIAKSNNLLMELKRLKVKDLYTVKHSINVSLLSGLMGLWLQLSDEDVLELMLAGALHDVGKSYVSQDILNTPGQLSSKEFEEVKKHTVYGYKKLSKSEGIPETVKRVALEHHERLDGSGYPASKKVDELHFFTMIVTIADIFDASTTNKVYGSRMHPLTALRELEQNQQLGKIDSTLFKLFSNNIYKLFVGCTIELSNGMIGEIAFFHRLSPNRPIIRVEGKLMNLAHHPSVAIQDIY